MSGRRGWRGVLGALFVLAMAAEALAKVPETRPPVATGVVLAPDGGPAAAAQVMYFLRLAGGPTSRGSVKAQGDGGFAILHPAPDDPSPEAVATQLILWAARPGEVSAPYVNSAGPLRVTLRRVDEAQLGRVRLSAIDLQRQTRWPAPLNILLAPGAPGWFGLLRLKAGRSLEIEGVPPGRHAVLYFDDVGFHVGDEIEIPPKLLTTIEMPFAIELPAGMVGVVLENVGGRVVARLVIPGSPAERAGIAIGDELVEIGGQPATDVARSKQLLGGKPGEEVRVRVRRGQGLQELTLRRSTGAAPPKVRVSSAPIPPPPADEQAARALVPVREGETLLEVAPTVHTLAPPGPRGPLAPEPFSVRAPEGIGVADALRIVMHFDKDVFAPGIPVTLSLRGPGELELSKETTFHDSVMATTHCDPVVGGGPCHSRSVRMGVSGMLGFDVGELDTPGVYQLTVTAPGHGEVRRTVRVTNFALAPSFDRHQHLGLAGYQMVARAALRAEVIPGLRPATIQRVIYRDDQKTLEVDIVEVQGHHASLEAALGGDAALGGKRMKLPLRHKELLWRESGGTFEASWPSGNLLVRARGTGSFGRNEQALVDHYFSVYDSRW